MKTNTLKKQTKLTTYLALTAGAGFAATAANGATVVTFSGPGARTPTTSPQTPIGINIDMGFGGQYVDSTFDSQSLFRLQSGYFTRGSDNTGSSFGNGGLYRRDLGYFFGEAVAGDANYANVSFNGNDSVYEAVAQFHFGADGAAGVGQGYLIAIAKNSDNSALSISAGKAAIDAVPEPSSLALLALGSAGLLARRNRKLAA